MKIAHAFTLVISASLTFAILGGAMGFVLARYFPQYYRSLYTHGRDPDFDPFAVGVGQGLTQGLTGGAVVGLLLVAILAWYHAKRKPGGGGAA